jgi:SM-20-related protein
MQPQFEQLIQGVMEHKYGTQEGFLPEDLVARLRGNLLRHFEAGNMKPAGVGKRFTFQQNLEVRGDLIRWLDESSEDQAEQAFFDTVQSFVDYLNATCYTGINAFEFHYALYGEGSFYKRHLDQFHQDHGRKYSFLVYLNENWQVEDGGQLVLYLENEAVTIQPEGGRAVFFKADEVEHEVLPANRRRMSIAGWLKRI